MANKLEGKVAIVTGAGRGLGKAEAIALATQGAKVVINDLGGATDGSGTSKSPADEVVLEIRKLGGHAVSNYDSVTTWAGGEAIIKAAVDNFGRLDILVNNAGILRDRMIFNMSEEEWDAVIKVHLYGHFYCTRHACAYFRQQRSGRIVNTSSASGLGQMGQANYSAAKEGIVGFTRTVARDMGRYGVTCNAIRPGAVTRLSVSPDIQSAWEKSKAEGLSNAGLPEGMEKLTPEAVAAMVVFLCLDEAANINGCTFDVYNAAMIGGPIGIGIYSEPAIYRSIHKDGTWTLEELMNIVPKTLTRGLANPAPPQPTK